MINAGGFILIRFADVMLAAPGVLAALALLGGFTALFGGLVMLTQPAVKTSLAWSTVAQMGFMIFQCGLALFPHCAAAHRGSLALQGPRIPGIGLGRRSDRSKPPPRTGGAAERRDNRQSVCDFARHVRSRRARLRFCRQVAAGRSRLGAILIFGVAYLLVQGLADAAPRELTQRMVVYSSRCGGRLLRAAEPAPFTSPQARYRQRHRPVRSTGR